MFVPPGGATVAGLIGWRRDESDAAPGAAAGARQAVRGDTRVCAQVRRT